ncbi:MAG: DUF4968 domain-containing protein [Bacteroidales bacterium]|nr:DUF4968 domain-containing protein [Bacteroidales bacterium]
MKKLLISLAVLALAACSGDGVKLKTEDGTLCLRPLADNAVRVTLAGDLAVPELEELVYTENVTAPKYKVKKTPEAVTVTLPAMSVKFDRATGALSFFDAKGGLLLQESARSIAESSIDGVPCYDVSESFVSPEDEHLYGTGQFQDGFLDIRGLSRRLTQVNTQISLPYVISSKGYALQWNGYGLTEFNPCSECTELSRIDAEAGSQTVNATGTSGNRREMRWFSDFEGELSIPESGRYALLLDMGQSMSRRQFLQIDDDVVIDCSNTWLPPTTSTIVELEAGTHSLHATGVKGDAPRLYTRRIDNTTTFHSPVATALDYTVYAGSADECIASYRRLTGEVPHMQDWMFGYIHCRERYSSSDDILENAAGFRQRGIPLDVIVQDWQWWGKYGWNALRFDEDHYPDPLALTDSLHRDDVHLMLSVWSKVDRNSEVGKRLDENGCYIADTDWIDFFNQDAADFYCRNFLDSLGRFGIDAWWFDATEPENDDLAGRKVGTDGLPGDFYRNVYPLKVNSTMYGSLRTLSDDEPVILTRSAFSGIQRYGVVTWSGDVGNDFETLRREIAGGLGQMASGLPWWTFDAGGFFRPFNQYDDAEYQERMLRWIQVSVFLPFMRVHGYMSQTEPWRYSAQTERIFAKCIEQRKALQPYVIDCARKVSEEGWTMMRPLVFDFPQDGQALLQDSEYMFGTDYLVCPVLEAGVSELTVYLPENEAGWEDIRDGSRHDGGQYCTVPVDIEAIPVFRRLNQ